MNFASQRKEALTPFLAVKNGRNQVLIANNIFHNKWAQAFTSMGKCLTITLITMRELGYASRHCSLKVLGHALLSEVDLWF